MSLRQQILLLLNNSKKEMTLKEIYTNFPNIKKTTIRGRVYENLGNGISRIGKGLYISSNGIVELGDTLKVVDRMVEQGDLFDFIFLDIPYTSQGQKGGNRNLYALPTITPEEFGGLVPKLETLLKTDKSPLIFMFTSGKSSARVYDKYMAQFGKTDLIINERSGTYTKLWKNGNRMNMGRYLMPKEHIHIFSRSGEVDNINEWAIHFQNVPDKSYPTAKPYRMIEKLVEQGTEVKDWVLDAFAGTGKVMRACKKLDRMCHSIDSNPKAIQDFLLPQSGLLF